MKKRNVLRFEEVWVKDERCDGYIRNLWSGSTGSLTQNISSVQQLRHSFKDLRIGKVAEETKRIEAMLQEEIR